jgi:aarF domain-containing kinase
MKEELADECDYRREASFLRKFASSSYLGDDHRFKVPWVWEKSTDRVLVMEHVDGQSIGEAGVLLAQKDRNDVSPSFSPLLKLESVFRVLFTDCFDHH